MGRILRALGRIKQEKSVFNVTIEPVKVRIFTNQAFNFKLQILRGKQSPRCSKIVQVDRSIKNTDIKVVNFDNESFSFPCTYFVKDSDPGEKMFTLQILKIFPGPGGNTVVIA